MTTAKSQDRSNQRYRTRKDLIAAAAELVKSGKRPTLDEVAAAAFVSRATAYRYFPSIEALLLEAPLDREVPDGGALFADDPSTDPEERIDRAEAAMHRSVFDNETAIRLMLAAAIARGPADESVPVRQNRRSQLIDAALAPARTRFDKATYERLRAALAVIFGSESMVVFRDVLRLDENTARRVKSWAVRSLVRTALNESRTTKR